MTKISTCFENQNNIFGTGSFNKDKLKKEINKNNFRKMIYFEL